MSKEADVPDVQIFQGTIIHATDSNPVEVHTNSVLVIRNGRVEHLGPAEGHIADLLRKYDVTREKVTSLSDRQLLIPGLVDSHIHACQYPNAGLAMDMPLLEWLQEYTYPLEARYSDDYFAERVYRAVVQRTLQHGTTCASYFASIHRPATELLADICIERGQRALVGKSCADVNAPSYYCESTDGSVRESRSFVNTLLARRSQLVLPTITPRFAITCTARLLEGLGQLTKEFDLHVQSHLNETQPEKQLIEKLFPEADHYTDVYQRAGLMGKKTVMAHVVHVLDDELEVLKSTCTGVSHCPNSNISIRSGLADVRRMEEAGINVGLGTDVSGGYHPSVLDSVRAAVQTSNLHAIHREGANKIGYEPLSYRDGFRLATLGGATALGLDDKIGNFATGKQFDALVVNVGRPGSQVDIFQPLPPEQLLQKFLFLGDDRDIESVYVAGRKVMSAAGGDASSVVNGR